MTPNDAPSRALQQDARAWSTFTGAKYTSALRQMRSPLAQGFLGERISARRLIAVLSDHELVGAHHGDPVLGEHGYRSESPWSFDGKTDFIQLALITDMLRMFTPDPSPEVDSYSLKHTAEWFLGPHCPYVSNGRVIWAAAAIGLPIADPDGDGPNLLIGVGEREHDYVRRVVGRGHTAPQADHYRPAGYEYLQTALTRAAAGEPMADSWVPPETVGEAAPFHDWLVRQVHRNGVMGDLASDYSASVRDSDHRISRSPSELLAIFHEVSHSPEAYDAVVVAITEWFEVEPFPEPVRTARVGGSEHEHEGWGAGAGTAEHYEYLCPCGDGKIVEEHDNVPGFREHDVWIDCDRCQAEWKLVENRPVREWGLEPTTPSDSA